MNYETKATNGTAVAVETREAQRAMTGADIVVETLEARGTKHVFGVSGAKIDKIYDRLLDSSQNQLPRRATLARSRLMQPAVQVARQVNRSPNGFSLHAQIMMPRLK